MRTKEEIKENLLALERWSTRIRERKKEVEEELADALAEFKVGQRVIQTYGRKSEEYEIAGVFLWTDSHVRYRGRKVLKSGDLHKNSQEMWGTIVAKPGEAES